MKEKDKILPSINYHLWRPCNMSCKFCFATFEDTKIKLPKGHLNKTDSLKLIDKIIDAGFKKITFAGGEPTLCKWLPELIKKSKDGGLTTMIVTNGFRMNSDYLSQLEGFLDWITISVDSLNPLVNFQTGRFYRNTIPDENYYNDIIFNIKNKGFRLKINTVIHKLNYKEELDNFIVKSNPERWKIFRVLPIKGQNDKHITDFKINTSQFELFKKNHEYLTKLGIDIVFEDNNDMLGSYLMIDPNGRFYDNLESEYIYSSPILEIGIQQAYSQIRIDYDKFVKRNGIYDWKIKK
jgi:radical S-adenosyl methionine domain-containing protein 2